MEQTYEDSVTVPAVERATDDSTIVPTKEENTDDIAALPEDGSTVDSATLLVGGRTPDDSAPTSTGEGRATTLPSEGTTVLSGTISTKGTTVDSSNIPSCEIITDDSKTVSTGEEKTDNSVASSAGKGTPDDSEPAKGLSEVSVASSADKKNPDDSAPTETLSKDSKASPVGEETALILTEKLSEAAVTSPVGESTADDSALVRTEEELSEESELSSEGKEAAADSTVVPTERQSEASEISSTDGAADDSTPTQEFSENSESSSAGEGTNYDFVILPAQAFSEDSESSPAQDESNDDAVVPVMKQDSTDQSSTDSTDRPNRPSVAAPVEVAQGPPADNIWSQLTRVQEEIRVLNERKLNEIYNIELSYNEGKAVHVQKRTSIIRGYPQFWAKALLKHPDISGMFEDDELVILKYLQFIEIKDMDYTEEYFTMCMTFSSNPYFTDTSIDIKRVPEDARCLIDIPEICWKDQHNALQSVPSTSGESSRKRSHPVAFLLNFLRRSVSDEEANKFVCLIKDDIWPNPISYLENVASSSDGSETLGSPESVEMTSDGDTDA